MKAQAFIVKDQHVLMLQEYVQSGNLVWNFPGGSVEHGETIEQACIREVKEETGFDVLIAHMLHYTSGKVTFLVQIVGGQLETDSVNPDNEDIVSAEWVPLTDEQRLDAKTRPIWEAYNHTAESLRTVYAVRHCKAEGQAPDAPLTNEGWEQAFQLDGCLALFQVDKIVSSPFTRAVQSISKLSGRRGLTIHTDERLSERVLSSEPMKDWLAALEHSFNDRKVCYPGGESSNVAMARIVSVINGLLSAEERTFVVCTHGNIMALLLAHYEDSFGFSTWKAFRNPDVYRFTFCGDSLIRIDRF
jgi:2,3-bisphosphoglycerate-dependent phosphoglycerate mutase